MGRGEVGITPPSIGSWRTKVPVNQPGSAIGTHRSYCLLFIV